MEYNADDGDDALEKYIFRGWLQDIWGVSVYWFPDENTTTFSVKTFFISHEHSDHIWDIYSDFF